MIAGAYILVFDWGNTLMRTFPECAGPMVDWPIVEAVPGVSSAVDRLYKKHTLVVGSNAVDSNSDQVRAALDRVCIGCRFEEIFTFHELETKKPDIEFFRTLETRLASTASQMVMVGDDWQADCLGAHNAGWRSVWYNPRNTPCPGLVPLHDIEIDKMEQLPAMLRKAFLPSYEESLSLLLQAETTHNLLAHVQTVASIGYLLALWVRQAGNAVNPILVHRGGLLHDISKIESKRSGKAEISHGKLGARRLSAAGQPLLAKITRRHQLDAILDDRSRPQSIEEILVYFADKLANGSQLVTPEERIAILAKRYPDSAAEIQKSRQPVLEMQAMLCDKMNMRCEDLLPRVKKALSNKINRG